MANVMAMLSRLPDNVRESVMETAAKMMPAVNSDPHSQEAVKKHWKKMNADFKNGGVADVIKRERRAVLTTTSSWNIKHYDAAVSSAGTNAASLLDTHAPIGVSSLKEGVNQGRFLIGRIVDSDGFWTINSGTFLVQDLMGLLVEIAVYNFSPDMFPKTFHKDRELCIVEPFFKIRADGSVGIRADRPQEEIFNYSFPGTAGEWKDLGNAFIKHSPDMALVSYESALQAPNKVIVDLVNETIATQSKARKKTSNAKAHGNIENDPLCLKVEVSKILTNLSSCEFILENFDKSLMYASRAFGLGLDRYKAAYRIAKALEGKGMKQESKDFAAWYYESHAKDNVNQNFSALVEEFGLIKKDDTHSSDGAAWIHSRTLKDIVDASAQVHSAIPFFNGIINESVIDGHTWLVFKKEGNGYFAEKKFLQARDTYIAALRRCPFVASIFQETSFILSNKGAAWLVLKSHFDSSTSTSSKGDTEIAVGGAILMFCSLLLNFYGNGRAWVRLSRFFVDQGKIHISEEFLKEGRSLLKSRRFELKFTGHDDLSEESTTKALGFVQQELETLNNDRNKEVYNLSEISTEEQLEQRMMHSSNQNSLFDGSDKKEMDQQIKVWEDIYNTYALASTLVPKNRFRKMRKFAGPTFDRKLGDYSAEFVRIRGIPDGLGDFARKILYRTFVSDRIHPWCKLMQWRMAWSGFDSKIPEGFVVDDGEMCKRWHGTAAFLAINQNPDKYAKIGAIVDIREPKARLQGTSYDSRIRSNYVNCPSHGEVCYLGSTHVSIGFNDLNSLMNMKWEKPQETKQSSPSRFVGLEMNEFNIAKTLVITEMLSSRSVPLECILQVWYSTVWSRETLGHFKKSLASVLKKGERNLAPHRNYTQGEWRPQNVSNTRVGAYLRQWLIAKPVSCKEARRLWLRNVFRQNSKIFNSISSCKDASNRVALTEHFLTGEVFGDRSFQPNNLNAVGSLTFWSCPEGSPPLEEDSIFNTYTMEDIMTTYSEDKKLNLVQVFVFRTMSILGNIRQMLIDENLSIELYFGKVEPVTNTSGHEIVKFITNNVQPQSIGWSNVIDYFVLRDLHDLARALSSHCKVIHYAYSMNWSTEVFGANIFDYNMIKDFHGANKIVDLAQGENFGGSNPKKTNILRDASAASDELFHFPDFNTPMISTDFVAAQIMRPYWVQHFFASAGSERRIGARLNRSPFIFTAHNCGLRFLSEGKSVAFSTLHRTSTQTYLSWTYDSSV